jgi:hypothetical protein
MMSIIPETKWSISWSFVTQIFFWSKLIKASKHDSQYRLRLGTATIPEHLSSLPVFSGVRVTRSLVLYVCFVDRCLSFCTFSFGHCVVCSSSIYGF